ncbi:MAG: NifU family protein [Alphaproteobacteria bacterium]|nr:NifU family protein [Alphaproteobacteria bacterium]
MSDKIKENQEVIETVQVLLEERIRPALQEHGGDVKFVGYDDGVLEVELCGACDGCPHARETMENGIAQLVSYFVPEVTEVRAVNMPDS